MARQADVDGDERPGTSRSDRERIVAGAGLVSPGRARFATFAELVAVMTSVVLGALLVEPVAERLDVAAPLLFLGGGLVLGLSWSSARGAVNPARLTDVETGALVVILCDGGLRTGWRRVRSELPAVLGLGLGGTLATFETVDNERLHPAGRRPDLAAGATVRRSRLTPVT